MAAPVRSQILRPYRSDAAPDRCDSPSRGRVVFTSSVDGFPATAMLAPHNASKFAIEGLADSLRQEVAPFGVAVSLVDPGATRTGMLDSVDESTELALSYLGEDGRKILRSTVQRAMRHSTLSSVCPMPRLIRGRWAMDEF